LLLVHLVPLGRERYDLYSEPPDAADDGALPADAGRMRRWLHAAGEQWQAYVDAARVGEATSGFARWRDTVICRLAETLDEQRTLKALRTSTQATAIFPAGLDPSVARSEVQRILSRSMSYHGKRLLIYLGLFVVSGALAIIPGPNVIAYYFGFQAFGHLQSWRGARNGAWTLEPNVDLAELATLATQPHAVRGGRVQDVAARLGLEHLPAFFERRAR
jgi:hypothetical protein